MILSYLRYPIRESFHYGLETDPVLIRIARRSQAVFNLVTLMEPQMHDWDFNLAAARKFPKTLALRDTMNPLFEGVFNNMGFYLAPETARALNRPKPLTLGEACVILRPMELHAVLLNDNDIHQAPFFASRFMQFHLQEREVVGSLLHTQSVAHEVEAT